MKETADGDKWSLIDDEWGGIDEEIIDVIRLLNDYGIVTDGSCAGHIDRASPVPFVSVFQFDKEGKFLSDETVKMLARVRALLDEFYCNRQVNEQVKIITETPAFIHNGGRLWSQWRSEVAKRVAVRKVGTEIPRPILTEAECEERRALLPTLQQEFFDFARFIEKQARDNNTM